MTDISRSLPPGDRKIAQLDRGANAPDFLLGCSHELFAIASLHRSERDAVTRAITAMSGRKRHMLIHELSAVRLNATRIAELTELLRNKLLDADDYESSENVYEA